jgi:hypothetical protein
MIIEGEKKEIDRRTYNNSLSNVILGEYTGDPSTSTNLVGTVDNLTFWVKNGTIKEVAYLFLYLNFPLQTINTTDRQYSTEQIQQLIKAIKTKLSNQQAVS